MTDYKKVYVDFVKACQTADDKMADGYEKLRKLSVVELEARCGIAAECASSVRDLILICGAYLEAKSARERERLAEALKIQARDIR